jgi:asparagine synthase (glutamine-hydrolysing)
MYAAAILDDETGRLTLTCDPLGIKPLYWSRPNVQGVAHVAFASEVRALVLLMEAMGVRPMPDMGVVSAYCTTIRTTMGDRTLFEGVQKLLPGQTLGFDLTDSALPCERSDWFARPPGSFLRGACSKEIAQRTRDVVVESVRRHLRSDVPVCVLLSGGLDSAIIASAAREHLDSMRTFCAGAREEGAPASPDFAFARELARDLGSRHQEAIVSRESFFASWMELGEHLMTPLSTPNEVAILAVSLALREQGCVVALSGEGADEIFAGYDAPLDIAARALREARCPTREAEGEVAMRAAAWIPPEQKRHLFTPDAHAATDEDACMREWFAGEFARLAAQREDDHPLQAHARWLRRTNLPGLLQRLDTASMRAGVEGRTPFADACVMDWGESLPLHEKFAHDGPMGSVRTKLALRRAFAGTLPGTILARPKASFPLPFERWLGGAEALRPGVSESLESVFARETFSPEAHAAIRSGQAPWTLAWPVLNLCMWGARVWG